MAAQEHDWYRTEYGVDVFRVDEGYHNGPECMRCHLAFCHHCSPRLWDSECDGNPYLF